MKLTIADTQGESTRGPMPHPWLDEELAEFNRVCRTEGYLLSAIRMEVDPGRLWFKDCLSIIAVRDANGKEIPGCYFGLLGGYPELDQRACIRHQLRCVLNRVCR